MIIVLQSAKNQMQSMINQFGTYKTRGEFGRSAFWIWHDKIQNEIKQVNIKDSKKVGTISYRFSTKYWGDILFDVLYIRNKGKFAGNNILITDFNFDEENFYNWLQHIAPIEHKEPQPNIPNTRCKPVDIKMGYTKVKAKSGLWTVADSNGKPISNDWFKDISNMRKTAKGEIAAIVNKDGWAYAFYPKRDNNHKLEKTGKTYRSLIGESAFNIAFKEALNELRAKKMLNESIGEDELITLNEDDLRGLVRTVLKIGRQYVRENNWQEYC